MHYVHHKCVQFQKMFHVKQKKQEAVRRTFYFLLLISYFLLIFHPAFLGRRISIRVPASVSFRVDSTGIPERLMTSTAWSMEL